MVRNPSEIARIEEEIKDLKVELKDLRHPKAYKEAIFRDIHKLQRQLEIPLTQYNRGKI